MRARRAAPLLSLRTWSRLTYQTNCISCITTLQCIRALIHFEPPPAAAAAVAAPQHWAIGLVVAYSERMCIVKWISASTRTEWCLVRKRGARVFFFNFISIVIGIFLLVLCERPSAQFSNWFCLSCKIVTAGCCKYTFFSLSMSPLLSAVSLRLLFSGSLRFFLSFVHVLNVL